MFHFTVKYYTHNLHMREINCWLIVTFFTQRLNQFILKKAS